MKIRHVSLTVALGSILLISACANRVGPVVVAGNFEAGKQEFIHGDYAQAFRDLTPSAQTGNPEAQYAVGYMYYYGLGITQDKGLALKWMGAAAEQGHPQAREALAEIQEHEYQGIQPFPGQVQSSSFVTQPQNPNNYASPEGVIVNDPSANAATQTKATWPPPKGQLADEGVANNAPPPPPTVEAPNNQSSNATLHFSENEATPAATVAANHDKNTALPSEGYTVQILASYNRQSVEHFINENNLHTKTHTYQVKRDGKDWYVLGYGNYPNKMAAETAIHQLPSKLQKANPWVRTTAELTLVGSGFENIG